MIIKNGRVFIDEDGIFKKIDIEVLNGVITRIGDNLKGDDIINADGKYITPGLVEAHSHIGVCEEAIQWEGDDLCENEPVTPQMRAIDAINPQDRAFKEALTGGVTTICTGFGSGGVVAGTFAIIENNGSSVIENMLIKSEAAMKVAFGENPRDFGRKGKQPNTRASVASMLRQCLYDAIDYKAKKDEAAIKGEFSKIDLGLEQMMLVIDKQIPLKAHAHRADDIITSIRIAKEFGIDMTLDHCTEGHLIVDFLKNAGYPAIVGPSFGSKSKYELKNKTFETVKVLVDAGLLVAITTDHNVNPQESLIMFAAMAVKAGLTQGEAMKCVTSNPAKILGISDKKGKIAISLDGDIVIWNGHPFDIQSRVEKVYVRGILI